MKALPETLIILFLCVIFAIGCTPTELPPPVEQEVQQPSSGSSNNQSYSGCALSVELIKERCGITPQNNIPLFSRFIDNQCEINARDVSGFAVATFKEISTEAFDQLYTGNIREVSGIADRAYVKERDYGNFDLYFKTGDRTGVFSAFSEQGKEEVYVYDMSLQKAVPLGGACNEEEAKKIVSNVLVPYLQGQVQ